MIVASEDRYHGIDDEFSLKVIRECELSYDEIPPHPFLDELFGHEQADLAGVVASTHDIAHTLKIDLASARYSEHQRSAIVNHRRISTDQLIGDSDPSNWLAELPPSRVAIWGEDDRIDAGQRQTLYLLYLALGYRLAVIGRAMFPK